MNQMGLMPTPVPVPNESVADDEDSFTDVNIGSNNMITNATKDEDLLQNEELNNMINPVIYVRGVRNDSFYLILSGKVMICSGHEGFFLEQGAFNYMGVDCLLNDSYVPDFSAKVIGKVKLMKICREDYRKCMSHVANNMRSIK